MKRRQHHHALDAVFVAQVQQFLGAEHIRIVASHTGELAGHDAAHVDYAVKPVAPEQVFENAFVKIDAVTGDVVAQVDLFPEIHRHQVAGVPELFDHLLGEGAGGTGYQDVGSALFGHQKSLFRSLSPLSISRLISALTCSTRSVTCSSGISRSPKTMGAPKFRCTLAGNTTGRATGA